MDATKRDIVTDMSNQPDPSGSLNIIRTIRRGVACVGALTVLMGLAAAGGQPASAATSAQAQSAVVSAVPSTATPAFGDGSVKSVIQVGNRMIAGGTFTSVTSPGTSSPVTRNYLAAFDATTGAVDPSFLPTVDGEVDALMVSSDGSTLYIGGAFTYVNGARSKSLAAINLGTGATVTSFVVPPMNGLVNDLKQQGNRLYVGGTFTLLGSTTHAGLASLNPTTGAVDPYVNLQMSGHHNYRGSGAIAGVGTKKLDITPDGTRMVAIGNFTQVSGQNRDQIVMIDLTGPTAAVSSNWNTSAYTPTCFSNAYDSYMRSLQFSPDGSYFVVVTTGGYYGGSFQACDAAARFETGSTGADVAPSWVDYTGTDSLYSVAVTGTAVYVGGHQRWLNNPYGQDYAGPGAVPRPGLAALDPVNGVPLSWNPGRNPRGHGAEALLATPTGLWVGSDTTYIGNYAYYRARVAFFPLTGGRTLPLANTGTLPGNVVLAGRLVTPAGTSADDALRRSYDGGTGVGPTNALANSGIPWSQARGAFMVNGKLFDGSSDGNMYSRTFNGTTFGPAALIDPYNDPIWSNVQNGSGGTYRGARTGFGNQLPNVTGMFFAGGRIYYTISGDPTLHSRPFNVDSGIVSDPETVANTSVNWSNAGGMFVAGNRIYWATTDDGNLHRAGFSNGQVDATSATVVSGPALDGNDWRTHALFLQAG